MRSIQARNHARGDQGATAVEYGLIVASIAIVIIVALLLLGNTIARGFQDSTNAMEAQAYQGSGACSTSWFADPAPACDPSTGVVDPSSCAAGATFGGAGTQDDPYTCVTPSGGGGGGADPCATFDGQNGTCDPDTGTLTCSSGYAASNGQCVTDVCGAFDGQNGTCADNAITCSSGFVLANGSCVVDVCSGFSDPNGSCVNNTVTCASGYTVANGQCVTDACAAFDGQNGSCTNNTITCSSGFVLSNGSCVADQCTGFSGNGTCDAVTGTLTCGAGFVASNGQCVSDQCTGFSGNGTCVPATGVITCNSGYVLVSGQCEADRCADFNGQNGTCSQATGAITCNSGYGRIGSVCVALPAYSGSTPTSPSGEQKMRNGASYSLPSIPSVQYAVTDCSGERASGCSNYTLSGSTITVDSRWKDQDRKATLTIAWTIPATDTHLAAAGTITVKLKKD